MNWDGLLERKLTYRQFLTWFEWLEMQWNLPTRTDHYLMQIALLLIQAHSADSSSVGLDTLKIKFSEAKKKTVTAEQRAQHMRNVLAVWVGRVGGQVREIGTPQDYEKVFSGEGGGEG